MATLETEHVHKVYSQIAEHFSDTRFKPWPRIAQFLSEQPTGSLIADVGCGNGKYLAVNRAVCCIGSDICPELVAIAGGRGHQVAIMDCLNLPYRSNVFDAAICIAVIHHLSTAERRLAAARELARVVRPGGRLLVYVWAMEQKKKKFDAQDVMVPWHLQRKYTDPSSKQSEESSNVTVKKKASRKRKSNKQDRKYEHHKQATTTEKATQDNKCITSAATAATHSSDGETDDSTLMAGLSALQLGSGDFDGSQGGHDRQEDSSVDSTQRSGSDAIKESFSSESLRVLPDSSSGVCSSRNSLAEQGYQTFQRYYHVFQEGELTGLFKCVSGVRVIEEFYDHENWYALVGKENS